MTAPTLSTLLDRIKQAVVPCNGCTLCCVNDLIVLHPECGDDPSRYETVEAINPLTGSAGRALAKKPGSTACLYLGPTGCTIHGHAPVICREFDCGLMYAKHSRAERRRMISAGYLSREVMDQGRRVQRERSAPIAEGVG